MAIRKGRLGRSIWKCTLNDIAAAKSAIIVGQWIPSSGSIFIFLQTIVLLGSQIPDSYFQRRIYFKIALYYLQSGIDE